MDPPTSLRSRLPPAALPAQSGLLSRACDGLRSDEPVAPLLFPKWLNAEQVRFEVAGGSYRLIVAFDFRRQIAYVTFIGTHAEYDAIDALTVSLYQEAAMDICPIRTDADHATELKEIERLWGAKSGSRNGDKLEVLVTLVEAYENSRWPVEPADPIETLKAHMEMTGRTQADLASLLRSRSRASEVLSRRRLLTLSMIHKISREWHLPAEVLVQPYKRALKPRRTKAA